MFCDGNCTEETKTDKGTLVKECGLWRTLTVTTKQTQEVKEHSMCVLDAIMNSLHRLEEVSVSQVATTQEQRNESAEHSFDVSKTIAQGFLGVIHAVTDDKKKVNVVKALQDIEARMLVRKELPDGQEKTDSH